MWWSTSLPEIALETNTVTVISYSSPTNTASAVKMCPLVSVLCPHLKIDPDPEFS